MWSISARFLPPFTSGCPSLLAMVEWDRDGERWTSSDITDFPGAPVPLSLPTGANLEFPRVASVSLVGHSCDFSEHSQVGTPLCLVSLPGGNAWLDSVCTPTAVLPAAPSLLLRPRPASPLLGKAGSGTSVSLGTHSKLVRQNH